MLRNLICVLMISLAPILCLAEAKNLPADGGEPGKAYRDCINAITKQDKAGIVALCFAKEDPWIQKTNIGYFTPETFALEVRQLKPAFRLIDVKISGGKMDGNTADLQVQGTMLLQRLEPTDEIVEVDRYPVKGTVQLSLVKGLWTCSSDNLEKAQ